MEYRRFGRTELAMPVFSCGGMRYQQKWQDLPLEQIEKEKQANLEATIHRAIDVGINHIETARGYGSSERQLGLVLPTFAREKLIVQTKIPPQEDPDKFLAFFDESLERLQLDYVDLLAIHGINNADALQKTIRPGGCLAAARELQRQGKARHVGFSTHGSTDLLMRAVNHDRDGGFDYINLHWYFIFQKHWQVIERATELDMGVFIISPSDKGGKLYDPPPRLVELCEPLHPMVFNNLFCLSHPQVHTLSIGAARPSDFDRHLETLPLLARAGELLPPIVARLRAAMDEAIGFRDHEAMAYQLPEVEEAPAGLNLQMMLFMRNVALAWGMTNYAKMRFNLMGNGGTWFPGAKPETVLDVPEEELIAAAGDAPWAEELPAMLREAVAMLGGEQVKRVSQS